MLVQHHRVCLLHPMMHTHFLNLWNGRRIMSDTFTLQTYQINDFFDLISRDLSQFLHNPATAAKGEICGFLMETRTEEGKGSSMVQYPVEKFLVSSGNGGIVDLHFDQIAPETQIKAALLAMRVSILGFLQHTMVRNAYSIITDDIDPLYAQCWVLPNVALIHDEYYEDRMEEIDPEYPEDTQDDVDRHFIALRRKHLSHHETLESLVQENLELDLLCSVAPVRIDSRDPESERLRFTFRKEE
jgi:hypothetical protein